MVQDISESSNDISHLSDEQVNLLGHIEALTSAFEELTVEIVGLRIDLQGERTDHRNLNITISNLTTGIADLQYELQRQHSSVPVVESVVSASSESVVAAPPEIESNTNTSNPEENPPVVDPPIDLPLQQFPEPQRPLQVGDTVRIVSRQRFGEIGRIIRFTTFRVVLLIPGVNQEIYRARHNLEHVEGILH